MALRLEMAFGGGAAMWLGMQSACNFAQARKEQGKITIRRLAEHRAGAPSLS
jgi:plasmid maintenance system antidote protein VapI